MSEEKTQAKPITRKTYLETVAKVKRLNYKLSQVEKVMVQMEEASANVETVSAKQVQAWVRILKRELGRTPTPQSDTSK